MNSNDELLVERIGRNIVQEVCRKLGCSTARQMYCIPHSGHTEICQECYEELIRMEAKTK